MPMAWKTKNRGKLMYDRHTEHTGKVCRCTAEDFDESELLLDVPISHGQAQIPPT